jgi:hypothetical protein
VTPEKIAEWMLGELRRETYLYQEVAVYEIGSKFGEEFTYINENGNMAIRRDVLSAFRKLTGGSVVWERSERVWRARESFDEPGRGQ